MRYQGVDDNAFRLQVAEIHAEALPKALALNLAVARNGELAPMLERLVIELSGRLATRAGTAQVNRLTGYLRIQLNYRLLKDKPEELRGTYLHELAHIVATLVHKENCHHDRRWKAIAIALGDNGERCHDMDVSAFRQKRKPPVRFEYTCACENRTWKLTKGKHEKYQHYKAKLGKKIYFCPTCKQGLDPTQQALLQYVANIVNEHEKK
jgi:predicted SprT family Zn-dependent metalloprotease